VRLLRRPTRACRGARTIQAFNSAHAGYAILFEEVDELWAEVRKKPSQRSKERLRAEAVQVAAMALRFIQDICDREPSDE